MGTQGPGPHRLGRTGQRRAKVLEQERNPSQWTCLPVACASRRIQLGGLPATAVDEVTNDGIEVARGLEPDDRRVEKLGRRYLAGRDKRALPDRVDIGQFECLCRVHRFGILAPHSPTGNRGSQERMRYTLRDG